MSLRKSKTTSPASRWWLMGVLLALGIALFGVFRNSGKGLEVSPSSGGAGSSPMANVPGNSPSQSPGGQESGGPRRANRSSLKRTMVKDESVSGQFPQVERLLSDVSLSEHQTAEGLYGIVRSSELSEAERDEALAHGLNLDFGAFAALANDSFLPEALAQRYLDALANHGHLPQSQLGGYLGLTQHGEEGIRTQAMAQLACLLENEALAETPDELRRLALERLDALRLAPPPHDQVTPENRSAGHPPE